VHIEPFRRGQVSTENNGGRQVDNWIQETAVLARAVGMPIDNDPCWRPEWQFEQARLAHARRRLALLPADQLEERT
jgi:hypothetical protein